MSETKAFDPESSGPAKIVGPVLGFELKTSPARLKIPFKFREDTHSADTGKTLSAMEHVIIFFNIHHVTRELWNLGQVEIRVQGLGQTARIPSSSVLSLKDFPFNQVLIMTHSIPAHEFSPDVYEVRLNLMNGSRNTICQEVSRFIISPRGIIPHPGNQDRSTPEEQG